MAVTQDMKVPQLDEAKFCEDFKISKFLKFQEKKFDFLSFYEFFGGSWR